MEEQKTLAIKAPLPMGTRGVELESFESLWRFAQCVAASPFAPRGMEKAEAIVPAIQLGLELGLSPMSALQNVAVINGRPGIYGDAALALVRASGLCESYEQEIEGENDTRRAVVVSKRTDNKPITSTFSVADAKRAGLWGKQGPWSQYPERMLLFRARGFNLRDNFGDVLKGLSTVEELGDMKRAVAHEVPTSEIQFGAPGLPDEEPIARAENIEVENGQTEKRKRRTKAEMEAARMATGLVQQHIAATEAKPPAPPKATPLEGLRNLINASPISEDEFLEKLRDNGYVDAATLDEIPDDILVSVTPSFMSLAEEIIREALKPDEEASPFK